MGKAERNRRENARAKIAAQQAAARRAERRRQALIAGGSVLVVLAVVVAFIVIKLAHSTTPAHSTDVADARAIPAVAQQVTSVPASTLDAVGKGGASSLTSLSGAPALTAGGKPEVVYMGAEYCPYCAAERWAVAVALSRFGTFANLHFIHSSSTDTDPNTPTLTFYRSSYSSKYLAFTPVELYTDKPAASGSGYTTLQTPTKSQNALMAKYDAPPYVPSADSGAFPFVDIGNKYLISGAQYQPTALSGLTWSQVAADIKNPSSPVAKDVDGAANSITAAICKATNGQPATVCSSAGAQAGSGAL